MARAPEPRFVVVGHVTRSHGTGGAVVVRFLTDAPDETFQPGRELRLADREGRSPDEFFPPVMVAGVRPHQGGFLVTFEGVTDRDRADILRGRYLLRAFHEVEPAGPDEYFYHELLGSQVVTTEGRELGTVREVYELEPAHLLEVSDGSTEILIPMTKTVVVSVDRASGRIVVDLPEGLLEL